MNNTAALIAPVLMLLACMSTSMALADEVVLSYDFEKPEDIASWGRSAAVADDAHAGQHALQITRRDWVLAPDKVEIDPTATYELSAMVKVPQGSQPTKMLLSTRFYNADGEMIDPTAVAVIPGSDNTLAAEAKVGDTELLLSKPVETQMVAIAFNVKDDLSDLPNNDNVRVAVDRATRKVDMSQEAAGMRIKLRTPMKQAYPAGAAVRLHQYVDFVNQGSPVDDTWKKVSFRIKGQSELGKPKKQTFWQGTQRMRIAIFVGVNMPGNDMQLLVDDIKLVKISNP